MAREQDVTEKESKKTSNRGGSGEEISEGAAPQGEKLEALVGFIKENWKSVLTELVTVGVTTYLSHGKKGKEVIDGKTEKTHSRH